jgi:hypothetical protein
MNTITEAKLNKQVQSIHKDLYLSIIDGNFLAHVMYKDIIVDMFPHERTYTPLDSKGMILQRIRDYEQYESNN